MHNIEIRSFLYFLNRVQESINRINNMEKMIKTFMSLLKLFFIKIYNITHPNPRRNNIFLEEWDYLIILDACRYDLFKQNNILKGNLLKYYSEGSSTIEWIFNNIDHNKKMELKNIVYISGNPYVSNYFLHRRYNYIPFFKIIDVWKDGWDEKYNTVHPNEINKATIASIIRNPLKKHIIHYMQPHHPFIGKIKILENGFKESRNEILNQFNKYDQDKIWDLLERKEIDVEYAWEAYRENLHLVLNYVNKLVPKLSGKICITSDHGNLFGKYGLFYAHPSSSTFKELLQVPWLTLDN